MNYTDYINETKELVNTWLTKNSDKIDVTDIDGLKNTLREDDVILGSEIREKKSRDEIASTLGEAVLDKKFINTAERILPEEDLFDAFWQGPENVDKILRFVAIEELDLREMIKNL